MKEMWERPRIAVQTFVAGEYAASCCIEVHFRVEETQTFDPLGLGDDGAAMWSSWVGTSAQGGRIENDQPERWYPNGDGSYLDEHSGSCMNTGNNFLYVDETAGNALGIWEYSAEQKKDLSGVVTYWSDTDGDKKYTAGDLIAWITYNTSAFWRHWGYLGDQDKNRPNHS